MLDETIDIFDSKQTWLATGAYSPESQLKICMWSFDENQENDHW